MEAFAGQEHYAHTAADYRPAHGLKKDLERLRTLMRRTVIFSCRQETYVVGAFQALHQIGNELLWGKAPKRPVLRWDDDVEASRRRCEKSPFGESVQRKGCGLGRHAKRRSGLTAGENIPTS